MKLVTGVIYEIESNSIGQNIRLIYKRCEFDPNLGMEWYEFLLSPP